MAKNIEGIPYAKSCLFLYHCAGKEGGTCMGAWDVQRNPDEANERARTWKESCRAPEKIDEAVREVTGNFPQNP